MRTLTVDDEFLGLSRLKRILNELHVESIAEFESPELALSSFDTGKFDVAFLDISMPTMSGLELANALLEIDPNIFIVFQTAHSEYALDAFKSSALGYLLKPIKTPHVEEILQRVKKYKKTSEQMQKKLMGKSGDRIYIIDIDDIYYIKADLDEVIVKTKDIELYVKKKIGELDTLLSDKNFFRIHRSIIVNVDKIKSMQSVEQSKLQISFEGIDSKVTSSKEGAKEFRDFLEGKTL